MEEINEIKKGAKIEPGPQHPYEVQVRDMETGQVIYKNISRAGAFCSMEKVIEFSHEPEGQHQIFAFGNPVLQFYCVDQLSKWFQSEGLPRTMEELKRQGFIVTNIDDMNEIFGKRKDPMPGWPPEEETE